MIQKAVIALGAANLLLLLIVSALSFALLSRPRFQHTDKFYWVMFDTRTAQLCDARTPRPKKNVFDAVNDDPFSPPHMPYCMELK